MKNVFFSLLLVMAGGIYRADAAQATPSSSPAQDVTRTDAAKPRASQDAKKRADAKKQRQSAATKSKPAPSQQPASGLPGRISDSGPLALAGDGKPDGTGDARPKGDSSRTEQPAASGRSAAKPGATSSGAALTDIYRIGEGDVLDIRLLNAPSRGSTLFTVVSGGLLDYPLVGDAIRVSGLTTDEVARRLATLIKLYDHPKVIVNIREYASHNVIVTGLVNDPGTKVLRREAMPLYAVVAEAQPRADATTATIYRHGTSPIVVQLSDAEATSTTILPGDIIKLSAPPPAPPAPPQYFYVGGQVGDPGQKSFHAGLTLTQGLLVAGGVTRFAGSKVRVSRQGLDGRLTSTEYNLKQIESGKIPDPPLQAGDRVEVRRSGW